MVTLRKASHEDCETIFRWRNHPKVRQHFFDARELSYSEHKKWFYNSLQRDDRIILVAYVDGKPVGVIRFDVSKAVSNKAEIDIYVAPEFQGKGLGKRILAEGENWLKKNTEINQLIARVKEENLASVRMFKRRGFGPKYILFEKNLTSNQ